MKRESKLLKAAYILAILGGAVYFWWNSYITLDSIIVGVVGVLILNGQGINGEKVDGLQWRLDDLSRRLGYPPESDNTPRP